MILAVENVRVFILAENRLLREALTRILSKKNDIRVVGASAFTPQICDLITAAVPLLRSPNYVSFPKYVRPSPA